MLMYVTLPYYENPNHNQILVPYPKESFELPKQKFNHFTM